MAKFRALILDEFIDNVLVALQIDGNIHVVDIKRTLPRWETLPQPYSSEQEIRKCQSTLNRLERILGALGFKKELGLLEQLFKPRERAIIETNFEEERSLLEDAESIVATVEEEIEEKIRKFQLFRQILWELRAAKFDVEELQSTERLYIKLGSISTEEIAPLENELKRKTGYVSIYSSGKKRVKFAALVSLARFSEEIEATLGKHGFQEIPVPKGLSGDPNSCLRFIDDQSRNISRKYEKQILCLHDGLSAKIERLRIKGRLGRTEKVFVLEGWIPEEKGDDIRALIDSASEGHATVAISGPDESEAEIPALLRDTKVFGHFRMLTEMYGTPLYNEIDPTPFLAIFFTFFVGLMSADLAIGATIIVSSMLIRRGAGSRSQNMKSLSVVLLCIGLSAVFFGFLTGEFMGNLIEFPAIIISAADDPIEFLLMVIAIGMMHIVFGSILGIFNNIFRREFRKMIGDQLSTLLLIASAAFFLSTGRFEPQGPSVIAYAVGVVGLATLIIGKGPLGLLDLTRLLSNVISYVRILALNMATAWMSRTFVLLGGLLVGVYLMGPVLNGVLLLFSHFFIVFISVFATFAHALRLHYVEFFGRFFTGGGTKFSPVTSKREYTILKPEAEKKEGEEEATK